MNDRPELTGKESVYLSQMTAYSGVNVCRNGLEELREIVISNRMNTENVQFSSNYR